MSSGTSDYLCYFCSGVIIFLFVMAIFQSLSGNDQDEVVVARVDCRRPNVREGLSYTSKNPTVQNQQATTKRMQVANRLSEKFGPTYQQDTTNAMRTKPVSKEYFKYPREKFTSTFAPQNDIQLVREMKMGNVSPFIGEIDV
jgi:hypothetical protein